MTEPKKGRKPASLRKREAGEADPNAPATLPGVGVAPAVEPIRVPADFYPTPLALARACTRWLQTRLDLPTVDLVVEPSAGDGVWVEAAREFWPAAEIRAVELRSEAKVFSAPFQHGVGNFLAENDQWERAPATSARLRMAVEDGETIIMPGNPPNLLAERHVGIALDRLGHTEAKEPMPRYLAFLLPSGFLGGQDRYRDLFKAGPRMEGLIPAPLRGGLRFVRQVVGRPDFTGGGGGGYEYMLFVWQAGWRGDEWTGGFLDWSKP